MRTITYRVHFEISYKSASFDFDNLIEAVIFLRNLSLKAVAEKDDETNSWLEIVVEEEASDGKETV